MPPPSCTGTSESTDAMIALIAASLPGLPARAPFRSTTCRRVAPIPVHCAAAFPGSLEYTVAFSMRPCSRRTHWPSLMSMAGMMIMAVAAESLGIPCGEIAEKSQPRDAAFFGMELGRENIIPRDGGGKAVRIAGGAGGEGGV